MTTKTRVLVVDDEEDAREMLSLILSQAGFDVDDAADGFAALAKMSRYRPDVVVTDLRMPGMTGVDLLQRIRRIWTIEMALAVRQNAGRGSAAI